MKLNSIFKAVLTAVAAFKMHEEELRPVIKVIKKTVSKKRKRPPEV